MVESEPLATVYVDASFVAFSRKKIQNSFFIFKSMQGANILNINSGICKEMFISAPLKGERGAPRYERWISLV